MVTLPMNDDISILIQSDCVFDFDVAYIVFFSSLGSSISKFSWLDSLQMCAYKKLCV